MTAPRPLIGLTGGIASGKSTAARFFAEEGARVIDADRVARAVVAPGTPALAELRAAFGAAILGPDGALDRPALGRLAFGDPAARARVNAIVHPRVAEAVARELAAARAAAPETLVVYDVPLLFEAGLADQVDLVVVVYLPRAEQSRRLQARDKLSAADAEARLAAQLDIEEKARRADLVLDNRGAPADLRRQVQMLVARLRAGQPAEFLVDKPIPTLYKEPT